MTRPVMNQNPPARPWVVTSLRDAGPGQHYRFRVVGMNHHYIPPRPFSWQVPSLGPNFDLDAVSPAAEGSQA